MWAMIVKEFRQLRRDRRTLAMMIVMPVVLLIVFGYAASFDVTTIPTVAAGPQASQAAHLLGKPFELVDVQPSQDRAWAQEQLRDGHAAVAVVTGNGQPEVLIDGSQLFTAKAAIASLSATAAKAAAAGTAGGQAVAAAPKVTVLYNPGLNTSDIMIPGLAGVVLVFVGTIITSLGVVRERQSGTLEQLAVMPLKPRDVFLGKIGPYFVVAALDLAIVVSVGVGLFGVPFRGSLAVFALGALLFLFVTLGLGVLISSVSENQGQAIQLSLMVTLPQILLSGLIFPLSSIAVGVRWISYLLPLTYFNEISRGVMLRAEPIGPLWQPFLFLALLGAVVFALASLRFRAYLAPAPPLATGYLSAGSGTYPDLSVAENLAFRAAAYRVPPQTARQRSAELLARAGLDKVTGRLAGQLSGGMRQKLGVIAAMLHRPDLLVLDEPTTGVDPVSRSDLWLLITRAAADGAAVVLATSYLDEAERAHHVLVLDAGSELAGGTADQIVAAMRGTLTVTGTRPTGEAGRRAWRRDGRWRVWDPDPADGSARDGGAVRPDLQDAVTVAALARELARSGAERESR